MSYKIQKYVNSSQAIIFDMDGVLIDSIPFYRQTKYEFLERYGIVDRRRISQYNTLGMGLKDIIQLFQKEFNLQGNIPELALEWRTLLYETLLKPGNLAILEGADAFIRKMYQTGKPLAVATGGHQEDMAKKLLLQIQLSDYFREIISSDDVLRGKPAPDVYLYTAEKLQKDPQECLVIEDAANGTIAAKKAGMCVIGVNKDTNVQEQLLAAGADIILNNLTEAL